MICKNCGAQMSDGAKFCPSCGHIEATTGQISSSSQSSIPRWFKWLLGLMAAFLALGLFFVMGREDLTDTVEEQLKALRENKITEAYYNFTSKDFQEATPFDKFKEFVKVFPALTENKSVRFIDRKSDDTVGSLEAILMTKGGLEVKAEYRLVYDKGNSKWKIQSVKFEDISVQQKPVSDEDNKAIAKVVEGQLQMINKKDFKNAYNEYTSTDFKKSTSQKQFDAFINTQAGFFNYKSIKLDKAVNEGETTRLSGSIATSDDQAVPVVFQLVNENGFWKILQIQAGNDGKPLNGEKADSTKKMEFSQFILGTAVDEEGVVLENHNSFPSSTKEIYLNIYVANGITDATITIELEHTESKTKIPTVETKLQEDGHAILRVVFSPPLEGWPKGNYQITASSSTGAKKTYDFKIE